jgi:hypothetical protein
LVASTASFCKILMDLAKRRSIKIFMAYRGVRIHVGPEEKLLEVYGIASITKFGTKIVRTHTGQARARVGIGNG